MLKETQKCPSHLLMYMMYMLTSGLSMLKNLLRHFTISQGLKNTMLKYVNSLNLEVKKLMKIVLKLRKQVKSQLFTTKKAFLITSICIIFHLKFEKIQVKWRQQVKKVSNSLKKIILKSICICIRSGEMELNNLMKWFFPQETDVIYICLSQYIFII